MNLIKKFKFSFLKILLLNLMPKIFNFLTKTLKSVRHILPLKSVLKKSLISNTVSVFLWHISTPSSVLVYTLPPIFSFLMSSYCLLYGFILMNCNAICNLFNTYGSRKMLETWISHKSCCYGFIFRETCRAGREN